MKSLHVEKWFRKVKIMEWLFAWLRAGTSPEKLALTIASGFVFGVFPMFGVPTALCSVAAAVWRLNFPVLQAVNYLVSPLQIALLWPFLRWGAALFGGVHLTHSWREYASVVAALHATTAWFCFAVPAGLIVYFAVRRLLRWQRRA
jgi:uncharacterized protein (DUF2062 family)